MSISHLEDLHLSHLNIAITYMLKEGGEVISYMVLFSLFKIEINFGWMVQFFSLILPFFSLFRSIQTHVRGKNKIEICFRNLVEWWRIGKSIDCWMGF